MRMRGWDGGRGGYLAPPEDTEYQENPEDTLKTPLSPSSTTPPNLSIYIFEPWMSAPTFHHVADALVTMCAGILDRTQNNWLQRKDDVIGTFQCYDLYGH